MFRKGKPNVETTIVGEKLSQILRKTFCDILGTNNIYDRTITMRFKLYVCTIHYPYKTVSDLPSVIFLSISAIMLYD